MNGAAWPLVPFLDAVDDATRGHKKTKQRDYLERGSYPVIDQGQAMVGGYTNDQAMLSHVDLPVVIFGDHTRCVKYVDFPFGAGADGVKVLRPREGIDALYLYHFIRSIQLHNGGYSRHFKYLKEVEVPVPPIEEQRRIAAVLTATASLRTLRQESLAKIDAFARSVFLEMFGVVSLMGGVISQTHPMGFLGDLADLRSGYGFPVALQGGTTGSIPFAKVGDISAIARAGNRWLSSAPNYVDNEDLATLKARVFPKGTVAFAKIGEAIRQNFRVITNVEALLDNNVMGAVPLGDVQSTFLFALLRAVDLYPLAQSTTVPSIRKSELAAMPAPLPDLATRSRFVELDQEIESRRASAVASMLRIDALHLSLQQRAFRGEL